MCARTRSNGWKTALKFCLQIEKDFDNKGLFEPQGADKTRRFLNGIKKNAANGGEYSEIGSKDVMCLRCVRKYERSAEKRIKKILLGAVAAVSVANETL